MAAKSARMCRKAGGLRRLWLCLRHGRSAEFLFEVSKLFPAWLWRYRNGVLLAADEPRLVVRQYTSYAFSLATSDDVSDLSRLGGIPASEVERRLGAGDAALIARNLRHGDKLVGVSWLHRGPCYIRGLAVRLPLAERSAYFYGGFISPEARLKGIYSTAIAGLSRMAKNEGLSPSYCIVEGVNYAALACHLRLNFRPVARIVRFCLLGLNVTSYRDLTEGHRRFRCFFGHPATDFTI